VYLFTFLSLENFIFIKIFLCPELSKQPF
jgi:hypothetical protein